MIIIEKNEGLKIPYEVVGKKITFDDDLTINLAKRQGDDDEHIDVCFDRDRNLVIGAAAGRSYVAELDIPAREYIEVPDEDYSFPDGNGSDGDSSVHTKLEPVPLDMDKVTLTLWAID